MSQRFVPVSIEEADKLWEARLLWYRWHPKVRSDRAEGPDAWAVDTSDAEFAKPSNYGDYTPTAMEDWIEYGYLCEE